MLTLSTGAAALPAVSYFQGFIIIVIIVIIIVIVIILVIVGIIRKNLGSSKNPQSQRLVAHPET